MLLPAYEFSLMQASSQLGCCGKLRSINSKVESYVTKKRKPHMNFSKNISMVLGQAGKVDLQVYGFLGLVLFTHLENCSVCGSVPCE